VLDAYPTAETRSYDEFHGHRHVVMHGDTGLAFIIDPETSTVINVLAGYADALELIEGCV
jgi:hypothetical protein